MTRVNAGCRGISIPSPFDQGIWELRKVDIYQQLWGCTHDLPKPPSNPEYWYGADLHMTSVCPLKVRVGLGANARKKKNSWKPVGVAIGKLPCHFLHLSDAPFLNYFLRLCKLVGPSPVCALTLFRAAIHGSTEPWDPWAPHSPIHGSVGGSEIPNRTSQLSTDRT